MELKQHFAALAENFSAKFPELKELSFLYLLTTFTVELAEEVASNNFNISINNRFLAINGLEGLINPQILRDLVDDDFLGLHGLSKDEIREIAIHLIEENLTIAKRHSDSPDIYALLEWLANNEQEATTIGKKTKGREEYVNKLCEGLKNPHIITYNLNDYEFDIDIKKLSNNGFRQFAEHFISEALRYGQQGFFIPENLAKFLVEVANPQSGNRIFNPWCGIGSVFLECQKQFPNRSFFFEGIVSNPFTYLLCIANLLANNPATEKTDKLSIDLQSNKVPHTVFAIETDKADVAIAVLPFGMKLHKGELNAELFNDSFNIPKAEYAFVELILSSLNDKGKAAIVVSENFLFSPQARFFRGKCVTNDWIERVISLPHGIFAPNTSIKSSIIVFNKNKADKGIIVFDGRDNKNPSKFQTARINISKIKADKNVDLRATKYALKSRKELNSILENSSYPVRKIKDLIESAVSGENYSPKITQQANGVSESLNYVRVADLSNDNANFNLDISKIQRRIASQNARRRSVINFSAVLVSKIGAKLKPTYFEFSGKPIVVGSDIVALKMKADVNIEYFLTQLHSQVVQIQLEMVSAGTTVARISKEDLLNIEIILPPLEEQQRQILELRGVITEKAVAQEKVARAKERIESIEYEVVANMNHSLKNKLGVIIDDYDSLERFLKRKERNNSSISFSDNIRPAFEDENPEDVETIEMITKRLKTNLLDASRVFNTSLKLQTRELKKTSVELVGYFRNELKPLHAGQNFAVEVVAEPKTKLFVSLDKEVFKDVVDNLVNNAKTHGFVETDCEYKIVFELSVLKDFYDEENETLANYARIIYKNDGKPFPEGFTFDDYKKHSSKAGKTQGTGIGGAIIERIIKMHGGKFSELPKELFSPFNVQFEILLPLDE